MPAAALGQRSFRGIEVVEAKAGLSEQDHRLGTRLLTRSRPELDRGVE